MKEKKFAVWPLMVLCLVATTSSSSPTPDDQVILSQISKALNQIAKKATPAVVSIASIKSVNLPTHLLDESTEKSDQMMLGVGSGVIVRSSGIILTNLHVVQNAAKVTVLLDEKHKVPAHLIGGDSKTDLAVIQLDQPPGTPLSTLQFGNSDQLGVGDWIVAVGSPFGLSHSVTSGIISAMGRGQLGMLDIEDFIQTDAAINPGNSGGPLLNAKGEMIGINTAIFSQSGGFSGIGFAIPSKIAKQVLEEILDHGRVVRGWAGLVAQDLDDSLAQYFHIPSKEGALVSQIQPNSPASKAHLKCGDVILKYGTNIVHSSGQLKTLVSSTHAATKIPIKISRNGSQLEITISIREQPELKGISSSQLGQRAGQTDPNRTGQMGVSVQDVTPEFSKMLQVPQKTGAIVAQVQPGSPAFEAGLSPGDVIVSANEKEVHSAKELLEIFNHLKKEELAILYVQKNPEEKIFIAVKKD